VHGHVVEPGDVKALGEALEVWRQRDAARTSADCLHLARNYSIERNVQATLDVLNEIVAA
jgi:hypothetical protein